MTTGMAPRSYRLGVVLLVVAMLWLGGVNRGQLPFTTQKSPATVVPTQQLGTFVSYVTPTVEPEERERQPSFPTPTAIALSTPTQTAAFQTVAPERAHPEVLTYTVQAGDSIPSIAERFGLRRETIVWANEELEADPDLLYTGQVLYILPVDGVYHTVQEGDTLASVAEQYRASVDAIVNCEYNYIIDVGGIAPGQKLVVPGGSKALHPGFIRFDIGIISKVKIEKPGNGSLVWPVPGVISQEYWDMHRAIDIAGPEGDVVVAVDAGVVVYASWSSSGYGYLVVIDHGNGFTSYYAHLYGFYVDVGQSVDQGQPIGARGSTGRSTGPHLHLELRRDGKPYNPLDWLPEG